MTPREVRGLRDVLTDVANVLQGVAGQATLLRCTMRAAVNEAGLQGAILRARSASNRLPPPRSGSRVR